jgi:hypothetical protein
MKYVTSVVSVALLLLVAVASAQPPAGGGQMQGQKIGIATSLQRGYATFKNNYIAAAGKMPDADYNFKPGSTPEARTFGQGISHIAQAQFGQCSGLKVTDANAMEMVKQGNNEVTRAAALYGILVHGNEMAGTAYVYLRSKNIVPPSTENAGRGMRGRGN